MVEFNRILCPIDVSDTSQRALTYATALANRYDLEVLHVLPAFEQERSQLPWPPPAPLLQYARARLEHAQRRASRHVPGAHC